MRLPLAVLGAALLGAACTTLGSGTPPRSGTPLATSPGASSNVRGHVLVAAAADLRFALDELVATWRSAHPKIEVEPVYGSSGNLLAQVRQGAPFDVFLSADADYPRELERAGLAEAGATRLYAIGRLVVWVPATSTLDVERRGLEVLTDPSVERVAIANPEHAPYGRAAVAAMESAGVYAAVEPKLVLGENVSQAAQFVESGNADAGVIALSLALAPTLRERGRYALVPLDAYPRVEQGVVVLDAAADPVAARAFVDFVLGPDGRMVLDRFGFLLPEP